MSTSIVDPHEERIRLRATLGLFCLLFLVILVYLPVRHAGFIWDDIPVFQQSSWMYHGDEWKQYLLTGFNDWKLYFRPWGVALLVLQARLFDGVPGPMHIVSLAMQLANVALVVILARRIALFHGEQSVLLPLFAGACFGLHPMLVETVVWIGCQFDQVQVFFALLGLLLSLRIQRRWLRASLVSACFILSAGAKESAALYPAIVVLVDWLIRTDRSAPLGQRFRAVVQANWPAYLLLMLTGVLYLLARHWAMGHLLRGTSFSEFIPDLARLDEMAYVYLKYWLVIVGVPIGLGPMHPADGMQFGAHTFVLLSRLVGSLFIFGVAVLALSRRFAYTGAVVIGATLYLFPVLGFYPARFDGSLYHERYAIGAVAISSILLPGVINEWRWALRNAMLLRKLVPLLALFWVGSAVVNIRATIPLWSNDLMLWRWAAEQYPYNVMVRSNFLSKLTGPSHFSEMRELIRDTIDRDMDCNMCYLNGFVSAVGNGDLAMAEQLKERLRSVDAMGSDRILTYIYLRTRGYLELRKGNSESAETLLKQSLAVEPGASFTYLYLTEALVAQGKSTEAAEAASAAVKTAHPPIAVSLRALTGRILQGEVVFAIPFESALTEPPENDEVESSQSTP